MASRGTVHHPAHQEEQALVHDALSRRERLESSRLANRILLYSFAGALVLSGLAFVADAIYLFRYLTAAVATFDPEAMVALNAMRVEALKPILLARMGLWKFILQSCGIMGGVSFGFLGFGLFLLGAKGDMDASLDDGQHKVQLARMAPGSFVILCAAVLIGICSLHPVQLQFGQDQFILPSGSAGPTANVQSTFPDKEDFANAFKKGSQSDARLQPEKKSTK